MAIAAGGFVLNVPEGRRKILLGAARPEELSRFQFLSEPVTHFDHSRRTPLVVFACFRDGEITHVADGKRGAAAGTGLSRLNMDKLEELKRPAGHQELIQAVPKRLQSHLARTLTQGGVLPPKTLGATVDVLVQFDPSLRARLARYSEARRKRLSQFSESERENLALQKETLTTALAIANIPTDAVLDWSPPEESFSFLDGLPGAQVREDAMLAVDHGVMPGFDFESGTQVASKTFVSASDPKLRLTVVMANRLPLEKQTGSDLIYYNEKYKSFVLVQYKAMEKEGEASVYRWRDIETDDLVKEIKRMDEVVREISKLGDDGSMEGFRLHQNPFFLKICPRAVLNPDDKGLFKGMYIPLEYWKRFQGDARSVGPKGGRYVSFENVGRRLANRDFVPLVAGAWVGTTIPQSAVLAKLIREVLATNKTVTLAIKRDPPPDDEGEAGSVLEPSFWGEDDEEEPPQMVLA